MAKKAKEVKPVVNEIVFSDTKESGVKYIVIRDGRRVSDSEYDTTEEARSEYDFWGRVIARHPDGTKIDIKTIKA